MGRSNGIFPPLRDGPVPHNLVPFRTVPRFPFLLDYLLAFPFFFCACEGRHAFCLVGLGVVINQARCPPSGTNRPSRSVVLTSMTAEEIVFPFFFLFKVLHK